MKQPDLTTRDHLLAVGLRLAKENGLRALTVRGVAKEAEVNLGSFVYHFKNREQFLNEIVETWYQPLLASLELTINNRLSPTENIYSVIKQITSFLLENRLFISYLAKDLLLGEIALQNFIQTIIPKHIHLMINLIKNAQEKKQIVNDAPTEIFIFIASSIGVPIIIQELFMQNITIKTPIATDETLNLRNAFIQFAIDPISIEKRIQWALKAIAYEAHKETP